MAVAEAQASPKASQELASQEQTWHGIVLQALKRNDISLVPYVPDRVLTTLIKNLHADPFFTTFPTAREEEAVGIISGACSNWNTAGGFTSEFIGENNFRQDDFRVVS